MRYQRLRRIIAIATVLGVGAAGVMVHRQVDSGCKFDVRLILLDSLSGRIETYALDHRALPRSLDALRDGRGPEWQGPYAAAKDLVDPWGSLIRYRIVGPPKRGFELLLVGADDAEGGSGAAEDRRCFFAWDAHAGVDRGLLPRRIDVEGSTGHRDAVYRD